MRRKVLLVSTAAAIIAVFAVRVIPPLRARAKAVAVLADTAGIPFPRPFAPDIEVRRVEIGGVEGDLYEPNDDAPAILFVPGAARRGTEDPRVVQAATALARADRRVFVPELRLYDRVFLEEDIETIRRAAVGLAEGGTIGVVGFSYGGSFTLIAAQDPQVQAHLGFVGVFGAYYDLLHIVQGITTGATILDGEEMPFETIPEAREILIDSIVRVVPGDQEAELRAAIQRGEGEDLPPKLRRVFDLIDNTDPRRAPALAAGLPDRYGAFLTRFSPSAGIERIEVPVYVMQARNDEATPWTEALYLERNLTDPRVMFLEHFSHVDPPGTLGLLLDAPDSWRFISWILAAQE